MVAQTLDGRLNITKIEISIVRVLRISCHPELLPDQKPHFITQLKKVIGLGYATSPHTDQIYTRLLGITKFGIRAFV